MNFNISNNIYNFSPKFKANKGIPNNMVDENKFERQPENDSFELSVGIVNDIHGQTNNMIRILSGIKGDVVLSAGDNDIGDEKNSAVHNATVQFMNMAKIKGTAFGNHELDTTQADAENLIKQMDAHVLSVNLKKQDNWEAAEDNIAEYGRADLDKKLEKSAILEVKGEKIGLIGASPMDLLDRLTHPNYHKDCYVEKLDKTIQEIQAEADNLKQQGVNKIFLLSHLGLKKDKQVAQNTDGIDVIISGHTHELVEGITKGENLFYSKSGEPVIMTEYGKDGNYFGQLNLTFDKNGVITKAQNNIADTGLFHKNLVNQKIFDQILGKPETIGFVEEAPLPPKSLVEENPHANFVCDAMRDQSGAEIAIWHNCGVRNFFHKGTIDSSEIKDISPFLDQVVVANVSEDKIVDLFKDAIKASYSSSSRKPGLFGVSGLDYTVDSQKGELVEMNFYDKNGKKHSINVNNPDKTKTYTVVTDEFLMSAGADFDVLAEEKDYIKRYDTDKDVLTCNYIKEKGEPVIINQTGRLKFV